MTAPDRHGTKRSDASGNPAFAEARIVVTGGSGFIGSHVVEALVAAQAKVTVVDDLSAGATDNLEGVRHQIEFVKADVRNGNALRPLLKDADSVWHLAANPEVRVGVLEPARLFDDNVGSTVALLDAMRRADVPRLVFTSTSTVYGDARVRPTPEDYGPLLPRSVYGASKLACEAAIAGYAGTFGGDALLFRFANVVGPRSNHGVSFDFVRKLRDNPAQLDVLGDGTQTKSYVSVEDTVAGMLHAARHAPPGVQAYNIGSRDAIPVSRIAELAVETLGLRSRIRYAGGTADGAGWAGDIKHMLLDTRRLETLGPGWSARHTSEEAIRRTLSWLAAQPAVAR